MYYTRVINNYLYDKHKLENLLRNLEKQTFFFFLFC